MIKIKAKIKLLCGKGKRKTPFYSGYRPLFLFKNDARTSGAIKLIDREEVKPGEEVTVWIYFLNKEYLVNEKNEVIKNFTFSESSEILGKGKILQVYECNEIDLE